MDGALELLAIGALMAMFTALLALLNKGQSDSVKADLNTFKTEVKAEFAAMRAEMADGFAAVRSEMAEIRGEMAVMRSDLTHVALQVGARPRPQTG